MLRSPDYAEWSVRTLFYVGGVATTFVGAWLSSKIHVYHEAQKNHQDELKGKVLEFLRSALQLQYGNLKFSLDWQAQQYNTEAAVHESPADFGPAFIFPDPGPITQNSLDEALFEDARKNHYRDLIFSWDKFRDSWTLHLYHRRNWLKNIAQDLLTWSNLPAFPNRTTSHSYIMHLALAQFIHNRLMQTDTAVLVLNQGDGTNWTIGDGTRTVALGTEEQMKQVMELTTSRLELNRKQASETQQEMEALQAERMSLLRQLSLAIAAKKLNRRCQLVSFL